MKAIKIYTQVDFDGFAFKQRFHTDHVLSYFVKWYIMIVIKLENRRNKLMKTFCKIGAYVAGAIGVAMLWGIAILTLQQYREDEHMLEDTKAS